jgi:hypothetical protein
MHWMTQVGSATSPGDATSFKQRQVVHCWTARWCTAGPPGGALLVVDRQVVHCWTARWRTAGGGPPGGALLDRQVAHCWWWTVSAPPYIHAVLPPVTRVPVHMSVCCSKLAAPPAACRSAPAQPSAAQPARPAAAPGGRTRWSGSAAACPDAHSWTLQQQGCRPGAPAQPPAPGSAGKDGQAEDVTAGPHTCKAGCRLCLVVPLCAVIMHLRMV